MNRDAAHSANLLDELKLRTADVVILWTRAESTSGVLALLTEQAPSATSFLSQKSAEFVSTASTLDSCSNKKFDGSRLLVPSIRAEAGPSYPPVGQTWGEFATYRAVHLLVKAIHESGANRARLATIWRAHQNNSTRLGTVSANGFLYPAAS